MNDKQGNPVQIYGSAYDKGALGGTSQTASQEKEIRVTSGQLEAIVMRCREELAESMRRTGTAAIAAIEANVLTVRVEHSLAAAEHHLMRRASGREFFQHYIEELAEQVYPDFARHVEDILPYTVTFTRVRVDCESDSIILAFGLRWKPSWVQTMVGANSTTAFNPA